MRIVFMGTPDFAVPCLEALIKSDDEVVAVFTQPDKPKGRGYKLTPPPVKELALTHNIPVYQPQSLKKGLEAEETIKVLKDLNPDLIVVVAYGKLLPKEVLDIPKIYCMNVHASLLPKYRGAGPIQWCVLNGEKKTGVTTMLMAEGLDTGDMLLKEETEILENETASELHDRLSLMGADVLIKTIDKIKNNEITPQKQNENEATYVTILTKELCPIDFSKSAKEIHNQIRGLSDWPCATAMLNNKKIKIFKSELVKDINKNAIPGEIIDNKKFVVNCGDGNSIKFIQIQAEGGKRMNAEDYLRGNKIELGTVLK